MPQEFVSVRAKKKLHKSRELRFEGERCLILRVEGVLL